MRIQNTQKPRMKSTTRSAREPIPSPAAQPYTFQPATAQPTATGNPSSTATRYSTSARRCRPRQAEVKLQMQNPNMVRTAGISSLPILRPHQHRFKKKKTHMSQRFHACTPEACRLFNEFLLCKIFGTHVASSFLAPVFPAQHSLKPRLTRHRFSCGKRFRLLLLSCSRAVVEIYSLHLSYSDRFYYNK